MIGWCFKQAILANPNVIQYTPSPKQGFLFVVKHQQANNQLQQPCDETDWKEAEGKDLHLRWSLRKLRNVEFHHRPILLTNGATSMSFDTPNQRVMRCLSFKVQYLPQFLPFNMSVKSSYGYVQLVLPQHEETPWHEAHASSHRIYLSFYPAYFHRFMKAKSEFQCEQLHLPPK